MLEARLPPAMHSKARAPVSWTSIDAGSGAYSAWTTPRWCRLATALQMSRMMPFRTAAGASASAGLQHGGVRQPT